jgi:hypothetical protein
MKQMLDVKRGVAAVLAIVFAFSIPAQAGMNSKKLMYVGGTITSIKEQTEGEPSTADEKSFIFTYKDGKLAIPYDRINDLEYGQKAGRRIGLAIAISPWFTAVKKEKALSYDRL